MRPGGSVGRISTGCWRSTGSVPICPAATPGTMSNATTASQTGSIFAAYCSIGVLPLTRLLIPFDQLPATVEVQLQVDAVQVVLHRALGQPQTVGDLLVARPGDDEFHDARLCAGQLGGGCCLGRGLFL